MAKDIPKATIAVLLVLTILVSIIGTWTVLESISIKEATPAEKTVQATDGSIKFVTEEKLEPVETNAKIMFEIK
ncbi:hypothetical protein AUJ83_04155 [Candidatus Woesearchaeota archaeon CG1_02_33_12]|nr:MAG: hypothetical protein AUJ83_04155 [Candidatus Woesearchaeota archaeon CG1_02_33_12]